MANPIRSFFGGLWQRVKEWFGRKKRPEEEPSPDGLPEAEQPIEDEEPRRVLSGSLPDRDSPLAGQPEARPAKDDSRMSPWESEEIPMEAPKARPSTVSPSLAGPAEELSGLAESSVPVVPPVDAGPESVEREPPPLESLPEAERPGGDSPRESIPSDMPKAPETPEERQGGEVDEDEPDEAPDAAGGGWDEVVEVIDDLSEPPASPREDGRRRAAPLHERQSRIQERARVKTQERLARMGRPPKRYPSPPRIEDTEGRLVPESGPPPEAERPAPRGQPESDSQPAPVVPPRQQPDEEPAQSNPSPAPAVTAAENQPEQPELPGGDPPRENVPSGIPEATETPAGEPASNAGESGPDEATDSLSEPPPREDGRRRAAPLHERQSRIQERARAKTQERLARMGRPPKRYPSPPRIEDTEDALAPESGPAADEDAAPDEEEQRPDKRRPKANDGATSPETVPDIEDLSGTGTETESPDETATPPRTDSPLGSVPPAAAPVTAADRPPVEGAVPLRPAASRQDVPQPPPGSEPETEERTPLPGDRPSQDEAATAAKEADKSEGMTAEQANRMISMLQELLRSTEEVLTALENVLERLGELAEALPNAGAMR